MSNDPRTLGQSLLFQHDLVIISRVVRDDILEWKWWLDSMDDIMY